MTHYLDAPTGTLTIYCAEPFHHGATVVVRSWDYYDDVEPRGWFLYDSTTDVLRAEQDPVPVEQLPVGSTVQYRHRVHVTCACGLDVILTHDRALAMVDRLVDGGVSRIELRRLAALVSLGR